MALLQAFPKGCLLQPTPRKAPFSDLLQRGGSLLSEKGCDIPPSPRPCSQPGFNLPSYQASHPYCS